MVKNRENIIITEHNKVGAELRVSEPHKASKNEVQKNLKKLMNEDKIIPAKRKKEIISIKGKSLTKQKEWWSLYQNFKEEL